MSLLTSLAAKGVGATSLAIIGYDAHALGKIKSKEAPINESGERLLDAFINTRKLRNPSIVEAHVQNWIFEKHLDATTPRHVEIVKGYFSGLFSTLKDKALPLVLGTGALFTKGLVSKLCALGLLLKSAQYFIFEMLHIGKPNNY